MDLTFNVCNSLAKTGLVMALNRFLTDDRPPIALCIGSDLVIGDSLGPICGTLLQERRAAGIFVYGTLRHPITAKEVKYLNDFIKKTHPQSKIIAIDAAVGAAGDIGLIKIANKGLKPGLGANKRFSSVGDVSIMGIVAEKSVFNYSLLNLTRLSLVYKMAEIIADAAAAFVSSEQTTYPLAI